MPTRLSTVLLLQLKNQHNIWSVSQRACLQFYPTKWKMWVTGQKLRNKLLRPYLSLWKNNSLTWKQTLGFIWVESSTVLFTRMWSLGSFWLKDDFWLEDFPSAPRAWKNLRSLCVVEKALLLPGRLSAALTPILHLTGAQWTESSLSDRGADSARPPVPGQWGEGRGLGRAGVLLAGLTDFRGAWQPLPARRASWPASVSHSWPRALGRDTPGCELGWPREGPRPVACHVKSSCWEGLRRVLAWPKSWGPHGDTPSAHGAVISLQKSRSGS